MRISAKTISEKLLTQEGVVSKAIPKEVSMVNMMNSGSYIKPGQSPRRKFTHLPVPLSQVYTRLKEDGMLQPKEPMLGYKPRRGNPNAYCEYHMGQ